MSNSDVVFFPNSPGVYKITNLSTGDFYIGSTNNLRTRKNHHFHKLSEGTHVNILLQDAYDQYGAENFEFDVIQECASTETIELEQKYIDDLQPKYNVNPNAGSMKGFKHTEESKKKISEARKNATSRFPAGFLAPTEKEKKEPESRVRKRVPKGKDPRALRNLKQYSHLTDEEFDQMYQETLLPKLSGDRGDFEQLIEEKMKKFETDYDLSEMKANDRVALRALCQAEITLDKMEDVSFELMGDTVRAEDLLVLDKLESWKAVLTKRIIDLQESLGISRKSRQSEGSESLIDEIERIKQASVHLWEEKLTYVYCPDCMQLLGNAWFTTPEEENTLIFHCKRCSKDVTTTSVALIKNKNKNVSDSAVPF